MDVLTVLRTCARRWYVFLPIAILAVWFAVHKASTATPIYKLSTSVIVLPPSELVTPANAPTSAVGINPFSQNGAAAPSLAQVANAPGTARAVAELGGRAAISAVSQQNNPVVTMSVQAPTAAMAVISLRDYVQATAAQFRDLQLHAGSPQAQLLQVQDLFAAGYGAPEITYSHRSRTETAIILGGIVAAMILSSAVDAVIVRRARPGRRGRRADHAGLNEETTTPAEGRPEAGRPDRQRESTIQPVFAPSRLDRSYPDGVADSRGSSATLEPDEVAPRIRGYGDAD